jgi:hypothetical protein
VTSSSDRGRRLASLGSRQCSQTPISIFDAEGFHLHFSNTRSVHNNSQNMEFILPRRDAVW